MLERYLEELAASAGRELSAFETRALVAETRAHLEDSIQARLELGLTLEQAEREAVAAFGSPRRIVRAVVVPDLARSVRLRLRWLVLFYVALAAYSVTVLMNRDIGLASFAMISVPLVGIAYGSFRSRRPAPVAILIVGLAATFTLNSMFALAIRPDGFIVPRNPLEYVIYPVYTCVVDLIFGGLGALAYRLCRRLRDGGLGI